LGLENTLWAGFFYSGAPLLRKITTPANLRIDINTGPDIYGQTTPADLGILLEDIYMCSEKGGGALVAAFPGEITQDKCKQMINYLEMDKIAVLIQAGLPGGVQLAHKHGWAVETNDSLTHTMGDAGIIYSPSSNYILAIFVYDPIQVVWEPVNKMVSELSRAVYNFFNLPVK